MSLDSEVDVGMLTEELSVRLNGSLLIGAQVRFVVIEIDVLHALTKKIFFGGRRWRSGLSDRRRSNSEARSSVLSATSTLGGEVIGGGIGRAHLLRATGLNGADAV